MKRRLDLALALIHDPSILFLDEPTTGLDPQSRTALWEEVGRLARDEGVTVFLTTQYLEEADVLADRVGIIDHGRIVAEGTPAQLKARDRQADGRGRAGESPDEPRAAAPGSCRASAARPPRARARSPCSSTATARCPTSIRALDQENLRAARDQPAPADARRRLPREDRPHARRLRRRVIVTARQICLIARRSVVRTFRQPGVWIPPLTFPLMLMAVNSNGLRAATHLPGFPTHSFLAFFLPFSFMQGALFASGIAGVDLARDIDTGFLNRLALTPVRGSALLLGQIGGAVGLGALQACVYLDGRARRRRPHRRRASPGAFVILVLAILIAVGFGGRSGSGSRCAPAPAKACSRSSRCSSSCSFISSMNLPRNLIEVGWFRDLATLNPVSYMIEALRSLVIEGWDAQALALGFGFTFALIARLAVARGAAAQGAGWRGREVARWTSRSRSPTGR